MAGKCVWLCVSVCLLWLSDRTTPILLYGPIGPSLGCGSVICHVGMCVCESPILLCPDPFPDSGGKCRRAENIIVAAMYKPQILISLCGLFSFKRKNHSGLEKIIFSSPASVATNTDIKRPACC